MPLTPGTEARRPPRRRAGVRATRATLAALALGLACSSQPAPAPRLHRVSIRAMTFEPAQLELRLGDEIEWVNDDLVPHTATAAGVFDSAVIAPAQRWRHRPTRAGDLAYTCTFHPMMTGSLRVR